MKKSFGSRVLHFLIGLLFFALLLAPMGCIYAITNLEMAQYADEAASPVTEKAYGEVKYVGRMDIPETITVSGTYVSTESLFMELPGMKNQYSPRLLVSVGDYIEEGTLIGYTEDGKKEIVSTAAGIVQELHFGSVSYVQLQNPDKLALKCQVSEKTYKIFQRTSLALTDKNGNAVEVLEMGKQVDYNGQISVLLSLSDGVFGATEEKVLLYTGRVYTQALVVPTNCLFRMENDPNTWYVRVVNENQVPIGNQEVKIGYSNGEYTCITGVEEGTLVDSGYAQIFGA